MMREIVLIGFPMEGFRVSLSFGPTKGIGILRNNATCKFGSCLEVDCGAEIEIKLVKMVRGSGFTLFSW
jgi:hypothetical protein